MLQLENSICVLDYISDFMINYKCPRCRKPMRILENFEDEIENCVCGNCGEKSLEVVMGGCWD